MRLLLIATICLILNFNAVGQLKKFDDIPKELLTHIDSMGTDQSSILNKYEGDYLSLTTRRLRKQFDFTNRKIAFITGPSGTKISCKKEYFNTDRDRCSNNYSPTCGRLYVFNEKQKEESGGYDAAIVYWCKVLLKADQITARLRKSSRAAK